MPKSINITGTAGKTYNLEELSNINTRNDSSEGLAVQIWKWHPDLTNEHKNPNPPNLVPGQIWISKRVKKGSADYIQLEGGN